MPHLSLPLALPNRGLDALGRVCAVRDLLLTAQDASGRRLLTELELDRIFELARAWRSPKESFETVVESLLAGVAREGRQAVDVYLEMADWPREHQEAVGELRAYVREHMMRVRPDLNAVKDALDKLTEKVASMFPQQPRYVIESAVAIGTTRGEGMKLRITARLILEQVWKHDRDDRERKFPSCS